MPKPPPALGAPSGGTILACSVHRSPSRRRPRPPHIGVGAIQRAADRASPSADRAAVQPKLACTAPPPPSAVSSGRLSWSALTRTSPNGRRSTPPRCWGDRRFRRRSVRCSRSPTTPRPAERAIRDLVTAVVGVNHDLLLLRPGGARPDVDPRRSIQRVGGARIRAVTRTPMSAVFPSADSATLSPHRRRREVGVRQLHVDHVSRDDLVCSVHLEPERTNTQAAPTPPLSWLPPISTVFPSEEIAELLPSSLPPITSDGAGIFCCSMNGSTRSGYRAPRSPSSTVGARPRASTTRAAPGRLHHSPRGRRSGAQRDPRPT